MYVVPALFTSAHGSPRRSRQASSARSPASPAVTSSGERLGLAPVAGSDRVTEPLLVAPDQQHARSLGAEHPGGGQADAAAGAGHDTRAVSQPEVQGAA